MPYDYEGNWTSDDAEINDRFFDVVPDPGPAAAAAPSGGGGGAMSEAEVAGWLRERGIDEGTIRDEAGYISRNYADADEDPRKVLEQSLPFYMQRALSGGDRGAGGYDTNENDPSVTIGGYTAPARFDSARRGVGGGAGGGAGAGGGGAWGSFGSAPGSINPFTGQFRAPTLADLYANPGTQARLAMGTDAIQKSAAARGNLLTGTTLRDLNQWAQDFATNEYDKVYGRAQEEFDDQFNIHGWNETNRFNSQRTNRMDDFGIFDTNRKFDLGAQDQSFRQGLMSDQNAWGQNVDSFNMARGQEGDIWDRMFKLSDYAFGASGGQANAAGNFGRAGSDLITGAGNARAAGTVGSANAWGNAVGGAGNAFGEAGLAQWYGSQDRIPPMYGPPEA